MTTRLRRCSSFLAVGLVVAALLACAGSGPSEPPGNGNGTVPPPPPPPPPGDATISLDPGVTHQTIVGWEGSDESGDVLDEYSIEQYQDELFDILVNEVGVNRVRLHVQSGAQNTRDWFADYQSGAVPYEQWRANRYKISPEREYHWSKIDFWVEHAIQPMRQRLAARGEELYVNLCYVNFETQVPNPVYHHWDHPEAYGAFMVAAFRHLDSRYGWVPDAVEIILEPDNVSGWTGQRIGAAIVAAGDSLRAAGYDPDFIAPSTSDMSKALTYFDQLIAVPRVREYLTDIAYHRYGGVSQSTLQQIASRARDFNLRTGMLEHIGSGYQNLHQDLKIGMISSWQQHVLAGRILDDNGGKYYMIDVSPLGGARFIEGQRTKFLKLYFLYVRSGAVRLGATSENDDLDPLAFRNTDGGFVVVVKASEGASFTIGGLPAGTYGVRYSTEAENGKDAGVQSIAAGQNLAASIPAEGVLTVFRR